MVQRHLPGDGHQVVGILRLLRQTEPLCEGGTPILRSGDHDRAGEGVSSRRGRVKWGGG